MKRIFLSLLSLFIVVSQAFSQSADEFFKTMLNKIKSYDNIEISFSCKLINKVADIDENMTGLCFIQGKSYKLNINNQEIICNGEILWTYLIEDKEVMISKAPEDNNTPLAIMNLYSDNVNTKFINNSNPKLKTIEVKENNENNFSSLEITVDAETFEIKNMHVLTPDNNEFIYILDKFITNQTLPDNFFIFDETQHPDVEIIDMR